MPVDRIQIRNIPRTKDPLDGTEYIVGQDAAGALAGSSFKATLESVSDYVVTQIPDYNPPQKDIPDSTDFITGQESDNSRFKTPVTGLRNISRAIVTITTNTTLSADDSGKAITNAGASASRTWTLPAAEVGRLYELRNATDAYTLTIQPAGSDRIGTGAATKWLRLLVRGLVVLECHIAGRWDIAVDSCITELQA